MEKIVRNPGLQHLAEKVFLNLDVEDLKICGQINQSCKQILENPMFLLRKFEHLTIENRNREAKLREEVTKLKGDKLELLRQNMSAQRELKMLREREVQLQTDLTMASREIQRLHRNARASSSSHQQQP